MRGKPLCIVDTSSLINSCEVELGKKSLDKWLWKEFEVKYSKTVLEEFLRGRSRGSSRRRWGDDIWQLPTISTHERILFKSLNREIGYPCGVCGKIIYRNESFAIDFDDDRDRGERHNCCVALDAIRTGEYLQVIFLIDDFHAIRDYTRNFFDIFLLGNTWSLLDFIIYLFVRHYNRITLEDAKYALRNAISQGSISSGESEKQLQRLNTYLKKVDRIAEAFSQIPGGRP